MYELNGRLNFQLSNPSRLKITCYGCTVHRKTHFTSLLFLRSPSTQTLQTHQSITCRAGARTWAFISLRTNKSQSVDTRALFCSPAIIHRVQFPLTGCQRPPVFIITKWWEVERKTSFHKEVDGKVKERNKIMKKIKKILDHVCQDSLKQSADP